MGLFLHRHTQLSFFHPPTLLLLWPQPARPQDPFYLTGKQVVVIVSQSMMKLSASMCFLFGMLHLPTRAQVWEGHSIYFWSPLWRWSKHRHPRLLSCFGAFHSSLTISHAGTAVPLISTRVTEIWFKWKSSPVFKFVSSWGKFNAVSSRIELPQTEWCYNLEK